MGLFGFGKDEPKPVDTRSALERGRDAQHEAGVVGRSATKMVEGLLDIGIDGRGPFDSAAKVADDALRKAGSPEAAIDALVSSHRRLAIAQGFVTSLGGFITLPVALPANVVGFYALATRLTAAIARVRGYDLSQQQIRSAVLLTLVGAEADDLLAKAGVVAPTGRLTNLAAQKLPASVLMVVNKAVGFRLLSTAGRKTFSRFGRNVPLIGGAVGGALDGYLLHKVGENAQKEFPTAAGRITAG